MDETKYPQITPARYPVGNPTFADIRERGQLYIDKTGLVYELVRGSDYVFLSRPRRFGKSLLMSTLKAYFEGRQDLFRGLAIDQLETEWRQYPVINISLGHGLFTSVEALEQRLRAEIEDNAELLGVSLSRPTADTLFNELIIRAYQKFGSKLVVLVDEYDKPLLDNMHCDGKLYEDLRDMLRGFYACIKDRAAYLRFAMITGVSKFSQVNIFSGLNNLRDISLLPAFNALCGISESEMIAKLTSDLAIFAEKNNQTIEGATGRFKELYDGYRFASVGENIYNPYSVLSALNDGQYGTYWFQSGTPSHLVRDLAERDIDFEVFEGVRATAEQMMGPYMPGCDPLPLLYQSGYLTIKDYDPESWMYTLGYPNREVSSGVFDELLKVIVPREGKTRFNAAAVRAKAIEGDPDGLMQLLNIGLQSYNYEQLDAPRTEKHMVIMLHALCMAMGLNVDGEVHTARGRIDMVIQTKRYIYLIEFKINSYPRRALRQIDDLGYAERFAGDPRRIIKIGANYSTAKRRLTGWLVE